MDKEGKSLMFGPSIPLNSAADNAKTGTKADMGAMTDLVRALKEVELHPKRLIRTNIVALGRLQERI